MLSGEISNTRQKNKTEKILLVSVILLTILRFFIAINLPLWYWGEGNYDDKLLLELAKNMSNGDWLGEYNYTTLVKRIGFPLFLVICNKLCLPYGFGLFLLYFIAVIIFLKAIKGIFHSFKLNIIIYLFLLYSPVMLNFNYVQRVYRNGLVIPLVLIVIACYIKLFHNIVFEKTDNILSWIVLCSIGLSWFYITREDSIWFLPFCLCATALSIIFLLKNKAHKSKILLIIVPVFSIFVVNILISSINYYNYGVFTTNDRSGTNFGTVMSYMIQIQNDNDTDEIWVSQDKIKEIMKISPSLKQMESEVLGQWDHGTWSKDGEITGDLFIWAIRSASKQSGYYIDAKKTDEYWGNVKSEIERAIDDNKIELYDTIQISNLMKGFDSKRIKKAVELTIKCIKSIRSQEGFESYAKISNGAVDEIRDSEIFLNSFLLYPTFEIAVQNGEIIAYDSEISPHMLSSLQCANLITKIYKYFSDILWWLAIGLFLIMIASAIKDCGIRDNIVFNSVICIGLLMTFFVLEFGVASFILWMEDLEFNCNYYSPCGLLLIQLFEVMVFSSAFMLGKEHIKKK